MDYITQNLAKFVVLVALGSFNLENGLFYQFWPTLSIDKVLRDVCVYLRQKWTRNSEMTKKDSVL